jgi:hypothetical protein
VSTDTEPDTTGPEVLDLDAADLNAADLDPADLQVLLQRLAAVERRVAELEPLADERDIETLMHRYIEACDHVRHAPYTASMFTPDAVWEGANRYEEFGVTTGRDAIEAMFVDTPELLPFTAHWLTNPVITVATDRQHATGTWEVIQAATFGRSNTPVWVAARYDNEFRRGPDGGWLIHRIRYTDVFVTPYADGWNTTPYVSPFEGATGAGDADPAA